jgi:hypothetical protein
MEISGISDVRVRHWPFVPKAHAAHSAADDGDEESQEVPSSPGSGKAAGDESDSMLPQARQTGVTGGASKKSDGSREVGGRELTPAQKELVAKLQARDREVRSHEAAHLAAAGAAASGGASFTYQVGPDGKMYAIGGEVPIDMSPGATPEETLMKAEQIRAAALAPDDPSSQDMAVASEAAQLEDQARRQMAAQASAAYGHTGSSTHSRLVNATA